MKKFLFKNLILIIIICLGLLLRTVLLSVSPPSLNEDEAALGYNAYSILKTGADEHGKFMPLILESFGDWKLPVYVYTDTVPVAILGLSDLSTRIPSIAAGVLGIILIYLISQKLFNKKSVSLFAALFYAVSPWNVYFSRAAYEVNLATAIFLGAFLAFLYAIDSRKRNILILFSGILFGLTLFTYSSYIVFSPLFVLFLVLYSFKKVKKNILLLFVPFLFFLAVSLYTNLVIGGSKISTTTIFNNKDIIYNRVDNFRKDTQKNPILFDRIYTKYAGVPYQILQNYLLSFSPTFLFDRGGEKLVHNLDGFGNLYVFDSLLLIAGLAGLFYAREKKIPFLAAWLVFAPLPSAVTLDAPNSTRLFILMPLFAIVSAYGAWSLAKILWNSLPGKAAFVVLSFLFILNVIYFLNLYFIHFGDHRAAFWHYGYKQVVEISKKYPNSEVVMRGPENFPYIYFLFYNSYDPKKFQEEAKYYPVTWDGFRYVKSFGRYSFVNALDFTKLKDNTFYVNDQMFVNDGVFVGQFKKIRLPNGDPVLGWYIKNPK